MSEVEERLRSWIETNLGGTVRSCELLDRWRDSWHVDLERDGEVVHLYVRGDRGEEFPPDPLEYEAAVIGVLGQQGIPVPVIFGICPDPHAIVMERAPGRVNLETAVDEAERVAVLEHLGEILADMHQLDIEPFVAAGMRRPTTPDQIALPYFQGCERYYRAHKSVPDPRIELLIRWTYRNVPEPPEQVRFLHTDPGQFLFDQGRVTVMLDFELASLGDPLMDIAGLRQRALADSMGDIRPLLRRYVQRSGTVLDPRRISYHSGQWLSASSVLMAEALRQPGPKTSYAEYLSWYVGCMLSALQAIAEYEGFDLPSELPEIPARRPSRWSPAFEVLAGKFDGDAVSGAHNRTAGRNITNFLANVDALGAWAEEEYVREAGALLGVEPADWSEADRLLEAHVLAGHGDDRQLIEIFNRWLLRQAVLLRGSYHHGFGRMMPVEELIDLGMSPEPVTTPAGA